MKERLTGAIILVALIVLLVPELLTGPARPAPAAASNPSEEPPLRSYTINLADDARSQLEMPRSSGPQMPQPGAPEQPANQQAIAPTQASTPAASPPPAQAARSEEPPKAQSSAPVMAARGAAALSRAGAAPDAAARVPAAKQAAQRAAPRAAAAADKSARTRSAVAAGGWVVQLGVFASRENAEHLAQEMKGKGFRASVSDVSGSSRKLYRVRVGPTADRAAAQELQGRLRAAGRPGTVVPYS